MDNGFISIAFSEVQTFYQFLFEFPVGDGERTGKGQNVESLKKNVKSLKIWKGSERQKSLRQKERQK